MLSLLIAACADTAVAAAGAGYGPPQARDRIEYRIRTILSETDQFKDGVYPNAAPTISLRMAVARITAADTIRPDELPTIGAASLLRDTLLRTR